jgi:hypothetical protein
LAQVKAVDGVPLDDLVCLLRDMMNWDGDLRPEMALVATSLKRLLGPEGADMGAYAADAVVGIVEDVTETDVAPRTEVLFLETTLPIGTETPLTVSEVTRDMRRILRQPDWEQRMPELQRLLARGERFVSRPLLEILDRAHVPWWKPLVKPSRPGEMQAALMLLCDHADDAVIQRARTLIDHPDGRVQAAAKFVLAQVGE